MEGHTSEQDLFSSNSSNSYRRETAMGAHVSYLALAKARLRELRRGGTGAAGAPALRGAGAARSPDTTGANDSPPHYEINELDEKRVGPTVETVPVSEGWEALLPPGTLL